MTRVFKISRSADAVAFFETAPGGGDPANPSSLRNRPLVDPGNWLGNIIFHSDLDYMEVSHGPTDTTISHAAVAAGTGPASGLGLNNLLFYSGVTTTHLLLTHSLGYVPDFLVVANGDTVFGGTSVQRLSDGRTRNVAAYATTTEIRLAERAVQTSSIMPAISVTYTIIVFKRPPAPSGNIGFKVDPVVKRVMMAREKFDSRRRYLQSVAGGTPYGFTAGRTVDLKNGAPRLVDPDGTITDIVPAGTAMYFAMTAEPTGSRTYGASQAYDGTFTGSPGILFKVP